MKYKVRFYISNKKNELEAIETCVTPDYSEAQFNLAVKNRLAYHKSCGMKACYQLMRFTKKDLK